jgi:hypothetical protein
VDIASDTYNCEPVCIKEHFLKFVPLKETTGDGITDTILQQLEEISLPIKSYVVKAMAMEAI